MTKYKIDFNATEAIENLKKDVRTNAEKTILDMVLEGIKTTGWHDASEWNSLKYRSDEEQVLVVLRNGTVCSESRSWIITDATGKLFRRYERDRIFYFMFMPKAPMVPMAEDE